MIRKSTIADDFVVAYTVNERLRISSITEVTIKRNKITACRRVSRTEEPATWSVLRGHVLAEHAPQKQSTAAR